MESSMIPVLLACKAPLNSWLRFKFRNPSTLLLVQESSALASGPNTEPLVSSIIPTTQIYHQRDIQWDFYKAGICSPGCYRDLLALTEQSYRALLSLNLVSRVTTSCHRSKDTEKHVAWCNMYKLGRQTWDQTRALQLLGCQTLGQLSP